MTPRTLLCFSLALVSIGCSSDDERPSRVGGQASGSPPAASRCEDGQARSCSHTLEQANGILSCFVGTQTCEAGFFGPCEDGLMHKQIAPARLFGPPKPTAPALFSLSSAVDCVDNPCDPSCQIFVEDPPDITATGGPGAPSDITVSAPPPDWDAPSGTASCSHSLCETGEFLDPDCHPCVDKVCAADVNCCTSSGGSEWDSNCVGLAYTECLSAPARAPLPEVSACDFAGFGLNRTRVVNAGSVLGGAIGSNASGSPMHVEIGGSGIIVDEVLSAGNVQINAGATVLKGVEASGTVSNNGTVSGTGVAPSSPFAPIALPGRSIDCVAADTTNTVSAGLTVPDGDTRVFIPAGAGTPAFQFREPGRFGGFQANGNDARLIFGESGTYTFARLHLDSSAEFSIEVAPGAQITIEVCGASDPIHFSGQALELQGALDLSTWGGGDIAPHQVQLYTNVATSVPLTASALQGLTLVAPQARIYSTGPAGDASGLIWARELELITDIHLSSDGFTGEACLSSGILEPTLSACPFSLTTPDMPRTRVEPCLSGLDCQSNSRCTDVATSASCQHSKCSEGASLGPTCRADDPCVNRICNERPSCCANTDGWTCIPGDRCVAAACGDSFVRGLEGCDDGNAVGSDGCSDDCQVEPGYVCEGEPSVCRATICGDGIREGSEDCDDGDLTPWDGCSATCQREPSCPAGGGPCSSQCGDGMILAGDLEECDDGNALDGDGCSASCTLEPGFTCETRASADASELELPVIYRDFATSGPSKHPDFESFRGYYITRGLVEDALNTSGVPVSTGICEAGNPISSPPCPNIGVWDGGATATGYQTTSSSAFEEWFEAGPRSRAYWDSVRLNRSGSAYRFAPGNSFYPVTGHPMFLGDTTLAASSGGQENFGFTSELRYWFEYQGGEELEFEGDDDVWVFVGGKLALDLGGLHRQVWGKLSFSGPDVIEDWWDPSGFHSQTRSLGLVVGNVYEISLFHAERAAWDSNFTLTLNGFFDKPSACTPICGDGVVVPGEVCDDGVNDGGSGECQPGCRSWDTTGQVIETWDSACVDLVKTECDAECDPASAASASFSEAGLCVANGDSHLDPSCSDIDLAIGFGCGQYIPVCNHGATDALPGAVLTFFPREAHQMSSDLPDTSWARGQCTVGAAIPSGTCIVQACDTALTAEESTVMVRAPSGQTECSELDNWTIKDPAESCPLSPAPTEVIEVYEATCPAEARPSWGLFTYNSVTPGLSRINFEARVAATEPELATEAWTQLGEAKQSPVDTQNCLYTSPIPECPIDFSSSLTNGPETVTARTNATTSELESLSTLELRATLLPDGANAPTLANWNITYSCLLDH